VQYRNGLIDDRPRLACQMRWTDTGSDFDIIAVGFWEDPARIAASAKAVKADETAPDDIRFLRDHELMSRG